MFLTKNRELLMKLEAELETLKTALIVMDPKVSTSADAYDGLRKQIAVAARSRQEHLVQLALFSRAVQRRASHEALADLVSQWMQQSGLLTILDASRPDLYEILDGDASDGSLEILSPAYFEPQSNVLVLRGEARWVVPQPAAEPGEPTDEQADTPQEVIA